MPHDVPLKIHDQGDAVKALQNSLIKAKYGALLGKHQADSKFGVCTEQAVTAFQRDHGLTPTGTADATTLARLQLALIAPTLTSVGPAATDTSHHPMARDWTAFNQLLADHVNPSLPTEKPLIVLDPGHGEYRYDGKTKVDPADWVVKPDGYHKVSRSHLHKNDVIDDYGYVPPKKMAHRMHEADVNLAVAKKMAEKLEAQGFEVILTRHERDDVVNNRFRARLETGADRKIMHLAIHADNCPHHHATGEVAYYSKYAPKHSPSIDFAKAMGEKSVQKHNTDLLISSALEHKKVPLALVEIGNMNCPRELAKMTSDTGQDEIATTLANRMTAYYERTHPKTPLVAASQGFNLSPMHTATLPGVASARQK